MKKFLFVYLLLLFALPCFAADTYVAVVETVSEKGTIGRSEKMFLTDKLRERAKKALPGYMGYVIMTRENIQQMLPPGKKIEDCEGECLVETGKNINAHYIAQARVGKFGNKLTLTVELYETMGNNLVSSFTARSADAEGLLDEIERQSGDMFAAISGAKQGVGAIASSKQDVGKAGGVEAGTFTDPDDGQTYKTVKIGKQIWMTPNLNYDTEYGWCYQNNSSNCQNYGGLYDWKTARKACPAGWHLPSKSEFETLMKAVGGSIVAGKKLKATNGWNGGGNGSDFFGFAALPAGYRNYNGTFLGAGSDARFWSSTEYGGHGAYALGLFYDREDANLYYYGKNVGFSVRCLKDSN